MLDTRVVRRLRLACKRRTDDLFVVEERPALLGLGAVVDVGDIVAAVHRRAAVCDEAREAVARGVDEAWRRRRPARRVDVARVVGVLKEPRHCRLGVAREPQCFGSLR